MIDHGHCFWLIWRHANTHGVKHGDIEIAGERVYLLNVSGRKRSCWVLQGDRWTATAEWEPFCIAAHTTVSGDLVAFERLATFVQLANDA